MTELAVLQALHKAARLVRGVEQPFPSPADRLDSFSVDSLDVLMIIVACEDMLQTYLSADPRASGFQTIGDIVTAFQNGTPYGLKQ